MLIIVRVSWIQLGTGEQYVQLAQENNFKEIPIIAPRGKIFDHQGKSLVTNQSLYTAIYLEPDIKKEEKIATAHRLAETLQLSYPQVIESMDIGMDGGGKSTIRKQPPYVPKKLKDRLSDQEVVKISENPSSFPGVHVLIEPLRQYRNDTFAVQTIGYVRPFSGAKSSLKKYKNVDRSSSHYLDWEQVGIDGIEYSYHDTLKGKHGYQLVRVNSSGKLVDILKEVPPQSGKDLYLTLDESMQLQAEQFTKQHLADLQQGKGVRPAPYAKTAYAVAMEVKTGKIRAMVSYPDYDPSMWNRKVTQKELSQLSFVMRNGTIQEAPYDARGSKDPEKEFTKHPFSVVPLGSTFKPLMVWMGLDQGVIQPQTTWSDPGSYYYAPATPPVRNSGGHNYGILTPEKALQKSSNTYMAWIATKWYRQDKMQSVRQFQQITHGFGLGVPTGVPLKGEQDGSEDYLIISKRNSGLGAMALASFGQAQRYTPMQLAQFTATLANHGVRLQPQLVEKVVDPATGITTVTQPKVLNKVPMKPDHVQVVVDGMVKVTQPGGTASHLFNDLPFPVAAKTGTSEQDIPGRGRVENSVFIAFAPANDPQIAVAVVVPEGGYGAVAAGPIAENLITTYYQRFMTKQP
ncbi:peptidoglycan D,D-transpeptidase FtsI family protein [Hazenella coriacea]|uniref:peptidoglycan D,D-transpeptidase FtsI family protein n=1 Tax=Hazenella coriacea TaxID=1179467 RepID=UPI001FB2B209|nr:penicillin-binding transpeptidase domain-containing protein [Hazenella coriacea]